MKRFIVPLLVLLGMSLGAFIAQAQVPGVNVARTLGISDESAIAGDVVSLTGQSENLELSKVLGDSKMYGVLQADPIVVYRTNDNIPVVTTGEVLVNVTTIAGPILVGDFVTSSKIPGKGQRTEQNMRGYMLGHALSSLGEQDGEPFDFEGKSYRQGQVKVLLNIRPVSFTGGSILQTLQSAQAASVDVIRDQQSRDRYIRYIIALLIVIFTVYFSYRTFGRNVTKGIEGIGRNPLAKVSIQSMIVLNMVLIGIVCLGGMFLALLVISL